MATDFFQLNNKMTIKVLVVLVKLFGVTRAFVWNVSVIYDSVEKLGL